MKKWLVVVLFIRVIWGLPGFCEEKTKSGPSVLLQHGDLKVSKNGRFLQHSDGTPFFFMGDTNWELFHRMNREEAEIYLENRRKKGFTVIQAVVLAILDGLNVPNPYGEKPLIDKDPLKPNEAYFKHVDFIVNLAAKKGIYIGILPTWGDKISKTRTGGQAIFTTENPDVPFQFGKFIGNRYKDTPNIIWILGGDRDANGFEDIWRAMAKGLHESDHGTHLITYHPLGYSSSSKWFHHDSWLDFNMIQSSHGSYDVPNYKIISDDYMKQPAKPVLDGELRYENHPVDWKPEKGWFNEFDVRQALYWSVFAGGCGVTYGCNDVWQVMAPGRKPETSSRNTWLETLDLPGSWDVFHLRTLMESRPYFDRIPDQSLVVSGQPKEAGAYIQATRGDEYAMIYTPYGSTFTVQMGKISGGKVKACWFDPRTGDTHPIGEFENKGTQSFDPPSEPERGNDWVLLLDDSSKTYSNF